MEQRGHRLPVPLAKGGQALGKRRVDHRVQPQAGQEPLHPMNGLRALLLERPQCPLGLPQDLVLRRRHPDTFYNRVSPRTKRTSIVSSFCPSSLSVFDRRYRRFPSRLAASTTTFCPP